MIKLSNRNRKSHNKGAVLIVILLILSVMISIAATMSERLFINFTRAESRLNHQQAYWYSIGVEALAKYAIKQSYQDNDTITLNQPWALEEQVFPLDYGVASGKIKDMQACFNINALSREGLQTDDNDKPYLVNVWQVILEEQGVQSYQAEVIADSTWEFLDEDDKVTSSYGVEDTSYEALQPAYLAANGMMADSSELRAVYQVDDSVMKAVQSIVCALPWNSWRLNVNTVDERNSVILVALFFPQLSSDDALSLIQNRPYDGWSSVDEFLAENEIQTVDNSIKNNAKKHLSVDSRYFELDAQVVVNESRVRVRSLLFSKDRREDVSVIRRRFGGIIERVSNRSAE